MAQFMTVYPMVYYLRYEKHLDKYTRRPTGAYVLVLSPNLRTGEYTPSCAHVCSCKRLTKTRWSSLLWDSGLY